MARSLSVNFIICVTYMIVRLCSQFGKGELHARFDIHKNAPCSHNYFLISHGYKRNLIFTKSTSFAYFLISCTNTSAIWYSQKVPIAPIPLFSQRLQARFDIQKEWQLCSFRCFSQGYKRDLIFIKSANCTHSVVFPTATSAIWYSQKVAIALIPLFF